MDSQRSASVTPYMITAVAVGAFFLIALDRTGLVPPLRPVTGRFYLWLVLLGAFALLLGVTNVVWVHLQRIKAGRSGWGQSLVLVTALATVLVAGMINPAGATSPFVEWIFDSVILPGQSTLFALLAFFMAAAAYRFLRIGRAGGSWMLASALLVLLVQMPALHSIWPETLRRATIWLVAEPVMAAARGALLAGAVALLVIAISAMIRQE